MCVVGLVDRRRGLFGAAWPWWMTHRCWLACRSCHLQRDGWQVGEFAAVRAWFADDRGMFAWFDGTARVRCVR